MHARDILKKGLAETGIHCSETQLDGFMAYLTELKKWNRAYSLSSLKEDRDIVVKHFIDSLFYLRAVPSGAVHIADFGAGAGFPGIPLKIMRPDIALALVDASKKKCAFLRHMVRRLHLTSTEVLQQRINASGGGLDGRYEVVVSRAAFKLGEFMDIACPYVRAHGRLVISKGPKMNEEFDEKPHLRDAVKEIIRIRLPFSGGERNLLVIECPSGVVRPGPHKL